MHWHELKYLKKGRSADRTQRRAQIYNTVTEAPSRFNLSKQMASTDK
jgi:hypothetical protein